MANENIDSSKEKIDFMEEILENLDKEPEHTQEDYKSLESKYNEEVSRREKIEADYNDLYKKYTDRFTETISNNRSYEKQEKEIEEPIEEKVIDIRSIF